MATQIDGYSQANQDGTFAFSGLLAIGQSFTGDGKTLASAQFFLQKTGSPSGNLTAKIYAHSGTFGSSSLPTGAALATSAPINATTLTGSFVMTSFAFSGGNQIVLVNGTKYVVMLEGNFPGFSDLPVVGIDTSSPSHAGNMSYQDSGSSYYTSPNDLCFAVLGDVPVVSSGMLRMF